MSRPTVVSPSILAADFLNLEAELASAEAAGADFHHIDVMDGHYVPNLTFGLPVIKQIKAKAKIPLDVHIMVSNPDVVALDYVAIGADVLTFHPEMSRHPHRLITEIRKAGAKAGIALNPGTPLGSAEALLPYVDLVMVMSVNPGFGGQSFIGESVERVKSLQGALQRIGRDQQVVIEVDGGINAETGRLVVAAGATMLVAGTYVFESPDRRARIDSLKVAGGSK